MRFYRCPWCGETSLRPIQKAVELSFPKYHTHSNKCPNCQHYYDVEPIYRTANKISILLAVSAFACAIIGGLLIEYGEAPAWVEICLFCYFIVGLLASLAIDKYYQGWTTTARRLDGDNGRKVPFRFCFTASVQICPPSEGGYRVQNLHFCEDAILGAEFRAERSRSKLSGPVIPVVVSDIVYTSKYQAVCKVGFIEEKRYSQKDVEAGMEFSLIDDRVFATGVVTGLLPEQEKKIS